MIRKEFKLAAGDVYNTVLIEQGRQALLKTGLFERVETDSIPTDKEGFRELRITVVKKLQAVVCGISGALHPAGSSCPAAVRPQPWPGGRRMW